MFYTSNVINIISSVALKFVTFIDGKAKVKVKFITTPLCGAILP